MANTVKHKIQGKFNSKTIELESVPVSVRKAWNRKNFDGGKYRKQRIEKRINAIKKVEGI